MTSNISYAECSGRERLLRIVDPGSFHEWLPPAQRLTSPHLAQLGVPSSFDDGVAIGRATLAGRPVFVAAQEGEFMGGGVGEVHGAKLVGLLRRALRDRPDAVLLLAESGGVRLHEANAGLIAVSEVMRALLDVRAAGIPVIVLIGGANGCFGGMGIVARCADRVVMSDIGRLAMSGPEVIEASHGVDEFDARDRRMVENLRDRGVIRRPVDLGIDPRDATRNLLAARSMRDLARASHGLYSPPKRFRNW